MKRAETLACSSPFPDELMVLLDDIIEILHSPQLTVLWENFIFLRRSKSIRIGSMFVDTNRERKPPMISPHHLLKEPFYRSNIALCTEHELYGMAFFIQSTV